MAVEKSKSILVTGASGFVGTTLVPLLLQAGHKLSVLTRDRRKLPATWLESVNVIEGDLNNEALCLQAVSGVHTVIHLADLAHVRSSDSTYNQSLHNMRQLAHAAQNSGVQQFIYISSCKANYPQHSAYGYNKKAAEDWLMSAAGAMQVVCLRPGIIYGKAMRNSLATLLKVLRQPMLPLFPASQNPISMISVDDCSRALVLMVDKSELYEKVWELNDGVNYSLSDLVGRIRQHYALPLPRWPLPKALLRCLCLLAEPFSRLGLLPLSLATYEVLYNEHYPAKSDFAKASDFTPASDFSRFLQQQIPAKIP